MSVKVITPPATEPLTLAEVKRHLKIDADITDEDDDITEMIVDARIYCEGVQNRAFITQTLEEILDDFPDSPHDLPRPPLQSVTSITYTDEDGASDTVSADDYVVDADGFKGRIALKSGETWPTITLQEIAGVKIRFIAGYGDSASDVPNNVKRAMKLLIGHWHKNREATGKAGPEIALAVESLLSLDRVWPV